MLERWEGSDGLVVWRSPLLAELGVPHLFSTRRGPGGRELDAGELDGPVTARLLEAAGAPGRRLVTVAQVHGAEVHRADGASLHDGPRPRADALTTTDPELMLLVRVADCVPILLADAAGRRVAAVHAGWRGLLAGVVPRAVDALGGRGLLGAVGPCLCPRHFEVGPEVAARFAASNLEGVVHRAPGLRPHVDLRAAAAIQLDRAGVAPLDRSEACTFCDAAELWSFRRDVTRGGRARTGRLGALIGPRAA
jgi:hypothetical protein